MIVTGYGVSTSPGMELYNNFGSKVAKDAGSSNYMVLRDDTANCTNPRCRKRFEIAGIKTMAFLDEQPSALPGGQRRVM